MVRSRTTQIVDADNRPVGRVDDVLLTIPDNGDPPEVTGLLTGAQALGERLGGLTGRLTAAVASRLRTGEPHAQPTTIRATAVGDHSDLVHLNVPISALPHLAGLERWLGTHLIEGLPGAGDARD